MPICAEIGFMNFRLNRMFSKARILPLVVLPVALLLASCESISPSTVARLIRGEKPESVARSVLKAQAIKTTSEATGIDIQRFHAMVTRLDRLVAEIWGKGKSKRPQRKKYVKYTNNYKTRAEVDFENGTVIVETVVTDKPNLHLKEAIVATLLTPSDPGVVDLYSDRSIQFTGKPFLYGVITDQDGKLIQYKWRAGRYADYLVAKKLQVVKSGNQVIRRVQIPMIADFMHANARQYAVPVQKASRQYKVDQNLIFGIIETESSFNPYAVSSAPAFGLMQIVPSTAGADVFKTVKGKSGQPSKEYLFDPAKNIDTGTAYLAILQDSYLAGITNPKSKEYAVISAYNGGAGNVLRTFHSNRNEAVRVINRMSPEQVRQYLTQRHPKAESRRYLTKVLSAKKRYMG